MSWMEMLEKGIDLVEWPDASGEDGHGRDDGSNFAAGAKSQDDAEAKHGIKVGDRVSPKGTNEVHTVTRVNGNSLETKQGDSSKVNQIHATKVDKLGKRK